MVQKASLNSRQRRHRRVRKRIFGTAERPRLAVYRSLRHIYAQLIIDGESRTVLSVSSLDPQLRTAEVDGKSDMARRVGQLLGERALAAGVEACVFDRGGYLYHGRVAALAEGARAAGLKF